jgi:hypothetical protein
MHEDGRMGRLFLRLLINALALWLTTLIIPAITIVPFSPGTTLEYVITLLLTERWPGGIPAPTPTFRAYSGAELRNLVSHAGFINTRLETDPNLENRSSGSVIAYKENQP